MPRARRRSLWGVFDLVRGTSDIGECPAESGAPTGARAEDERTSSPLRFRSPLGHYWALPRRHDVTIYADRVPCTGRSAALPLKSRSTLLCTYVSGPPTTGVGMGSGLTPGSHAEEHGRPQTNSPTPSPNTDPLQTNKP